MKLLLEWLRDPSVRGVDVDAGDRLTQHARMLARKRMLREVFQEFHHLFHGLDRQWLSGEGQRVELGAGVAPMRDSYPDVVSTDVVAMTMFPEESTPTLLYLSSSGVPQEPTETRCPVESKTW